MTSTPGFQMVGDPDAMVCEDGVCAVPEPAETAGDAEQPDLTGPGQNA